MKIPLHAVEIFLQPGELWFGDDNMRVRTILGSCVAVTLWHPQRRIGGMCHYMLPTRGRRKGGQNLDGKYADEALDLLVREMIEAGSRPAEYEAKLFGGGRMFHGMETSLHVPDNNVATARQLATRHGFRVVAQHLGGHGHRQVILDIWSGNAWLKHTPLPPAERAPPALLKAAMA